MIGTAHPIYYSGYKIKNGIGEVRSMCGGEETCVLGFGG